MSDPSTTSVVGLDIELPNGTPLAALVILKYLDEDGDVTYAVSATEGVSMVESLGMNGFADLRIREQLAWKEEI